MCSVEFVANGRVAAGGLNVGTTTNIGNSCQGHTKGVISLCQWKNNKDLHLRGESTSKVQSTNNSLQLGETSNCLEVGVVGNQETTTNGSQRWKRQIVQVWAVDKGQSTASGGQVWCREALEGIRIETHITGHIGERWHINFADVAESQIGSSFKVGEADFEIFSVCREGQRIGDIGKIIYIDGAQVRVVVDVHLSNSSQFNTRKGVQLSV